ncbi:MAG: hypothetical protein IPM35_32190 [Myxococcales bacterium]|nr:hypothetical protein [Myxococcales bacterium]
MTRSPAGTSLRIDIEPPLWLGFVELEVAREAAAMIALGRHLAPSTPNENLARMTFRVVYSALATVPDTWSARLSDASFELWSPDSESETEQVGEALDLLGRQLSALSAASSGAWLSTLVAAWREAALALGARFDESTLRLSHGERGSRVEARVVIDGKRLETRILLGAVGTPRPVPLPGALDSLGFAARAEDGTHLLCRDGLVSDGRAIAEALRAAISYSEAAFESAPYR